MHHWITFKNELPARDAARVRKVTTTLQGGALSSPKPQTTHFPLAPTPVHTNSHALQAGAVQTRFFYKTNAHGQRLSSKAYRLEHGGPVSVARDIAKNALANTHGSARHHVPSSVRAAVTRAVAHGHVTEAHGRKYCDKYARDASKGKMLIHIRERGKQKVRQYEATCVMKKHPSTRNIRHMKTKHVYVRYMETFAC